MNDWLVGLQAIVQPMPLLMLAVGTLAGIVIGAIPGLSAVMAVAVLMPFTFALTPLDGMMMMVGVYTATIYAGSIPAILMRVPGTPSSAAALLDGYPMARQGKAGQALSISLISSMSGAFLGAILLAFFAPLLASIALKVTQGQYFMLALFALTIIASLSEANLLKGLFAGLLGLLIATVGTDPLTGVARFTFGITELRSGLDFIPILIGLFGISEALQQYEKLFRYKVGEKVAVGSFKLGRKVWKRIWPGIAVGSPLGFLIGVLPGTGGEVGSFVSYNETRRITKDKSQFGKGDPLGLAAAETGHNSAVPGTLAPTLTLGIPGNSVAAIMIGVLTVHGLRPGPSLFTGNPELIYGIFWGFIFVPFLIAIIGFAGIRGWGQLLKIPPAVLWPAIIVICTVGAFSIRNSLFDVFVMTAAGLMGYLCDKKGIPTTPLVIGLLVGPIAEQGFRRATILEGGSFVWMLEPVTLALLILSIVSLTLTVLRSRKMARAERETPSDTMQ